MVQSIVAIRNAVRPHLEKLEAGDKFLVGVSGGADSLALAAALLKEAEPLALTAIAITVDHQLQENSSANAERVALQLKEMGYGKVLISKVVVSTESGIEAG
jgi:tRNA(Ile)-lysidine synthase